MFNIMLTDIKRFFRKEKKYLLLGLVGIVLIFYRFSLITNKIEGKVQLFQFLILIVLFQAAAYMIGALLEDKQLNDLKFVFTLPVNIKILILSKNFLALVICLGEYLFVSLFCIYSKVIVSIGINDIFKFISSLICSISMSNILVIFFHKRSVYPTYDFSENLKFAKQSFVQLLIVIPFSVLVLFIIIKNNINCLLVFLPSIGFYLISLEMLEKKLKNQSSFFEGADA